MSVPQKKFREIVFQVLYSYDLGQTDHQEIIDLLMNELAVTRKTVRMAIEKAGYIIHVHEETDAMIAEASVSYAFNRIQTVEKNILRLGIFELLFDDEIPPKVAISEAVRLARKFGSPESANFVNAVLDTLYKASKGEDVNIDQITNSIAELENRDKILKEAAEKDAQKEIKQDVE